METRLLNSKPDQVFMTAIMRNIPPKYGPVTCDGGRLKFHGDNEPDQAVLKEAERCAIIELNSEDVRVFTQHRIMFVTRDILGEMSLLTWCIQHFNSDNAFMIDDIRMAHAIVAWINETRVTGMRLVNDPTYYEDKHWPKPPDGAREFIQRNF